MLTDAMRAFLREHGATGVLWDLGNALRERFNLTTEELSEALKEWIRETC